MNNCLLACHLSFPLKSYCHSELRTVWPLDIKATKACLFMCSNNTGRNMALCLQMKMMRDEGVGMVIWV